MVLNCLYFGTNCNDGRVVFGKGGVRLVSIVRRCRKVEGSSLASPAVHGRVLVSENGLDCDAGTHVLRCGFFGGGS